MTWSASEKTIARGAFDAAFQRELAAMMVEFEAKAARAKEAWEMWEVQEYLARRQKDIDARYDYRYSQLLLLFAGLIREGWLQEQELAGLSEDKLVFIRTILGR